MDTDSAALSAELRIVLDPLVNLQAPDSPIAAIAITVTSHRPSADGNRRRGFGVVGKLQGARS